MMVSNLKKESPTLGGVGYDQAQEEHKNNETLAIVPHFEPLKHPLNFVEINPYKDQEPEQPAVASQILEGLLDTITPVDFEALAFPEVQQLQAEVKVLEDQLNNSEHPAKSEKENLNVLKQKIKRCKVTDKHILIITIETVLNLAEYNNWGICKNAAFIYLYNGTFWVRVEKEVLQNFLGQAAEKMGVEKFAARWFDFRDKLIKQFFVSAYLPKPEPPENTVLINLKNGTYEISLQGNILRPFDRKHFLLYQLPFSFNPNATAPLFSSFLNRVLPDPDAQKVLSEFLGYIFVRSKHLKLEKALLLFGSGANGKSVIYDIINALLGSENVSSYSLESLTDKNGYHRAMIAGKLLNYASEINGKLEASTFKQLASGEPVEARLPYFDPFIITDYAKLVFNLNELPREVEHTHAYFRRLIILSFNVTIPEHEQDKELAKKIIGSELSGVFNWILEGLERLLKNKRFTDCISADQANEEYKTTSDSVKLFIIENEYSPSTSRTILLKELYQGYRLFCNEDGCRPLNKQNFKRRLTHLNYIIERLNSGNNVYIESPNRPF